VNDGRATATVGQAARHHHGDDTTNDPEPNDVADNECRRSSPSIYGALSSHDRAANAATPNIPTPNA
jgi:hypothetical protein